MRCSDLDGNKGYAFFECDHPRTAERILDVKLHIICDRKVIVTPAVGKKGKEPTESTSRLSKRLFVGGLAPICTSGSKE